MNRKPRKQTRKKVVAKKPAPKRVSNRKYPARKCLKTDCDIIFEPTRKNQVYCCNQHRIDQNNDTTHAKEQLIRQLEKSYRHNEAVLKKLYSYMSRTNSKSIPGNYLEIENYNHQLYTDMTLNIKTQRIIYWCYDYGIEIFDKTQQTFIVHFKNK